MGVSMPKKPMWKHVPRVCLPLQIPLYVQILLAFFGDEWVEVEDHSTACARLLRGTTPNCDERIEPILICGRAPLPGPSKYPSQRS